MAPPSNLASALPPFQVQKSGKRQKKSWKRVVTKVTFVGPNFTRKAPKYERFIRPTGLRMTKVGLLLTAYSC